MNRTNGDVAKTISARSLWDQVCNAAWRCADPGVQFDSTINAWHTCPHDGRINASNPCSEYMFLDNTACNLASLNLMKFYDADSMHFDLEAFEHSVTIWTVVLEISVLMAAFPSRGIAEMSYRYRTLGLGYANLGAMLMQAKASPTTATKAARSARVSRRSSPAAPTPPAPAWPRSTAPIPASRTTGTRCSASSATTAGPPTGRRPRFERVRGSAHPPGTDRPRSRQRAVGPACRTPPTMLERATVAWDDALDLGEKHGFRNAQVTVIAPTGTIGLPHGLRHDRGRAGLRPHEVQEARRRRLLQDRQPVAAPGTRRTSAIRRGPDRRHPRRTSWARSA